MRRSAKSASVGFKRTHGIIPGQRVAIATAAITQRPGFPAITATIVLGQTVRKAMLSHPNADGR